MKTAMNKRWLVVVFGMGLAAVAWVAWGFVGTSALALAMTVLIAAVYGFGAWELRQFAQATQSLRGAVVQAQPPVADLQAWLLLLHPSLRQPVRQRIEGERSALPAPALTPYLVGLLVMLGMLGTFLGMVVTFKGAVFALEGSADLRAIRAALAEPIKGLGLSFGTSVAGVAASAMLGLLSALCRRERQDTVRALDACIATVLQGFSHAHQRQTLYQALELQAAAMPQVVAQLQSLVAGMAQRQEQLSTQLLAQQDNFHSEAASRYQQLAQTVGTSLQSSLSASAQMAGETIRPVVENAMAALAQESRLASQRQQEAAQLQQQGLAAQWEGSVHQVAQTWTEALHTHQTTQATQAQALEQTVQAYQRALEERSTQMQSALAAQAAQSLAAQAQADAERLRAWNVSLQQLASTLAAEWQQAGAQTQALQQRVGEALECAVADMSARVQIQAQHTLGAAAQMVEQSQALVQARSDAEAQFVQAQAARMEQLTGIWRNELSALRGQEASRGEAAVQRLDDLQGAVAQHLATLGAALEAPLTRMLQTASEVPRAAAEVIAQLRQEMTALGERDNLALAERSAMVAQVADLLATVEQASGQQRAAIDALVHSATAVLEQSASRFAEALGAQSGKVDEVAAHVAASAVELASLGESFGHGVGLFSASNDKLVASLQTLEGRLSQSMARSDEQLAYYVAQAREVIDLSITAQQGLVEDLRRLHGEAAEAAA